MTKDKRGTAGSGSIPLGGENDTVSIHAKDLILEEMPFDSGSTCKIYKCKCKSTLFRQGNHISSEELVSM